MEKEVKEFLLELRAEIKELNAKVDDLMAWKNKLMGAFIVVSAMSAFIIEEVKEKLGII